MTPELERRYIRQIQLPEIGPEGQARFARARVLVVGAGALGSAVISYLAAAGIGTLGIADGDRVERSNLARQILHEEGDIGRLKALSAADRVAELNPHIAVRAIGEMLDAQNAADLFAQFELIVDGSDNFATRFLLNAQAVRDGKPLVSAAIAGFNGQALTVSAATLPDAGCYACLVHPDTPPANHCRDLGVIGPLAGILGSMQAMEVLNLLLGTPALGRHLLQFDARTLRSRLIARTRDAHCAVCRAHG